VARSTKFPLRVVKILSDSEQALLFDANRGRHVLVDVGETVGDYVVQGITEDEVTLVGTDVPVEIALPSPEAKPARPVTKSKPADPYASDEPAPSDPYGDSEDQPVREVSATKAPAKAETRPAEADTTPKTEAQGPEHAAAPEPDTATEAATAEAPETADKAAAEAPETTKAEAPKPSGRIAKQAVAALLADFSLLAAAVDGTFTKTGVVLTRVQPGSLFAAAGLLVGDTILAVDGRPIRSLDDAADLYARGGTMKRATVQLTRAGKPLTLRVTIQ
jgi:membrane-associated protease RseP (regulator of RpoE activity)